MSNETAQAIDKEIRRIVEDGYDRAKHLLDEHRGQLETLAQALLEYETLSGDEIKKVIAGEAIDRGGDQGSGDPGGRIIDPEGQASQDWHRGPRRLRRLVPQRYPAEPIATAVTANSAAAMMENVTSAIVRTTALKRPSW